MEKQKIKKNDKQENVEVKKYKDELEKVSKQAEDYKNKYLRALADYQNFENRVGKEKEALRQGASRDFLLKLLPVIDDLMKAEVFVKDPGLKLVRDKFSQILKEESLEEIEVLGKEFDPHLAEAIEVVKGEKDNIIAEVLRKGYTLNGKVLRVAQVKVAKKIVNS
jgi:molecular chaperone GrpE